VRPRRVRGIRRAPLERSGTVRVDARRKTDGRPFLPHPESSNRLRLVARREDAEGLREARLLRAIDDGIEVAGERLVGQMTVTVDQWWLIEAPNKGRPAGQRIRDPGGTSPSKLMSLGLPPSGLAARIMPFDSIPINFAGLRLNTTPTVRPTSCSGS